MRRPYSDFQEPVTKHLEFVENVIARMARNSLFLKAWSVTLVAAILALTAQSPSIYSFAIASLPAFIFWGLDAFYLGQERNFRDLYDDVLKGNVSAFSMDTSGYETNFGGWWGSVWSRSVWPFHLVVVLTVLSAAVLLLVGLI